MALQIQTYLRDGDSFVPVSSNPKVQYSQDDSYYIEGYIDIRCGEIHFMNEKHLDYVSIFWEHIVSALEELVSGNSKAVAGFPDQPLDIVFLILPQEMIRMSIAERNNGNVYSNITCKKNDLFKSFFSESKHFFMCITQFVPEKEKWYADIVDKIDRLTEKYS